MSRSWRDHVSFTFTGAAEAYQVWIVDPESDPPKLMQIGDVWKSFGRSSRRRDRGAVVAKGWQAETMEGKNLGRYHSRQAAADAIEDERQGVRHR